MRTFVLAALVALTAAHSPFEHPGWPSQPAWPSRPAWPSQAAGSSQLNPTEAASPSAVPDATCISAPDASLIATSFGLTISNYTEALAVQLFTNNFTDQSDSVNTLIHEPGLQAQDAEFLAGQGAQPPVPFKILNLWNTCNTVVIRWLSAQALPVQGISIATVVPAIEGQGGGFGVGAQKWQISAIVAEFNSGAWLGNLGYPECKVVANATAS
ncbi:unnamed protein product [Aureobasidium vineae]|uniref:NTF2-like domain-containing protein n=1 Tax=Aureobasidium vineae TaxID=2773715 RepID=A0A9N8JHK8_9PEZI|nr:unnamed protein product [Aureobasidium vineae]